MPTNFFKKSSVPFLEDPEVFKDRQEQVNELRRHAYSFGNAKNSFKSTYRDNLCHIKNEDSRKNSEFMHSVIQGQSKDLRKTHLVMGY